jgi:hypothetical protein
MKNADFFKIPLPKWPECRVSGDSVTKEQAQEILIRTQDFHFSTNDTTFKKELYRAMGLTVTDQYPYVDWKDIDAEKEKYKCLEIYFLQNDQICSSYIGGPNGWLNWGGRVYETGKNIGKWPSVEDVYREWKLIAKEFPYLNLECQLLDSSHSEEAPKPLINFVVKNGKVSMKIPTAEFLACDFESQKNAFSQRIEARFLCGGGERGVSITGFRFALKQTEKSLKEKTKS